MKRLLLIAAALVLAAGVPTLTGCRRGRSARAYTLIRWGSPRPMSERVGGIQYMRPDGWKDAAAGVTRIRVSNFGPLQDDPATVANAKRFQELTGIEVELLPWAEPTVAARTVTILAAGSDAVDVLCYDHATTYMQLVGSPWLHPLDALWSDANLWKLYPAPLRKGLTAADGHIYGSIGQADTEMLFYRPSMVKTPPATWQELRETAKKVTTKDVWGCVFAAGGEMDVVYPLAAMVYAQGGRIVDAGRQRLVVSSPEGRNAWKMLADMVLVDRSAPASVTGYSRARAWQLFAAGRAAMALARAAEANRFKDPQASPAVRNDWAASPAPKWDASQPDANRASRLDLAGYAVNRSVDSKHKAAAMLFVDFVRSYEAASAELIGEGNDAAVLAVYDALPAAEMAAREARKAAMTNAVLEAFPPAGRALTDPIRERFARVVAGDRDADSALAELQARLDDYAVPEK